MIDASYLWAYSEVASLVEEKKKFPLTYLWLQLFLSDFRPEWLNQLTVANLYLKKIVAQFTPPIKHRMYSNQIISVHYLF